MSNKVKVRYSSLRFSFACACGCMHHRDFIYERLLPSSTRPRCAILALRYVEDKPGTSLRQCSPMRPRLEGLRRSVLLPALTSEETVYLAQCAFLAKPLFSVTECAICARPTSYQTQSRHPSKSRVPNAIISLLERREGGKETLLAEI